jgi:hypothetical protein
VRPIQSEFGIELTSINEYARGVLEQSTRATESLNQE